MIRKLLIAVSIVLVIAVGAYLYLRNNKLRDFEPDIKQKLNALVLKASNGLYHLDIEKLETDVLKGEITLINAHLWADSIVYAQMEKQQLAPNDIFDIQVSQLAIDEIDAAGFMTNKEINLRRLFINQPVIKVSHKKQPYHLAEDSTKTVFQQIQKDLNNIKVDSIIINDVDFTYTNLKHKKVTKLLNVRFFLEDFLIDSATQFDKQRFLFSKNCLISLKDYTITTADQLYRFSVGELQIATITHAMQLKNVKFAPTVSMNNFYKKVGHQKDHFELSIRDILFTKIDWWALLGEESFFGQKIKMSNGRIKVYNDRSLAPDKRSKVGQYPHQLLMKLPFDINLDSITLANFNVSYTEKNPKSGQTGTISFNNISGTIRNITNIREEIKKNPVCVIQARARFLGKAPMSARFALNLANAASGNFSVTAHMGAIQGKDLNTITRPLGLVEVKSANIKSLDLNVKGNNYSGSGTVKLIYDDLKIAALKAEDHRLKKRGLLSFIANHFVIKTANPPSDTKQPRIESASIKREINKSFFNLIWKVTFTGAGKTVGFNPKK